MGHRNLLKVPDERFSDRHIVAIALTFCFGKPVCVKSVTPPYGYLQQDCLAVIQIFIVSFFKALKVSLLYMKKKKINPGYKF